MGVSRQGYYKHLQKSAEREELDENVLSKVREIRRYLPTVGVRKLHAMLKSALADTGIKISRDRLFDLLRKHNLLSRLKTRYCRTSNSKHSKELCPNLVKDLVVTRPNQVWVTDITYILTASGFCYLSMVTDVYSRRIVGHHLSRHMYAQDVLAVMAKACRSVHPKQGLIHHSDKGSQYCSKIYASFLDEHKIQRSMTGAGHCFDNAIAERVNGILKQEFGLGRVIRDFATAQKLAAESIAFYNSMRLHSSLGMLTPDAVYFKEFADDAA